MANYDPYGLPLELSGDFNTSLGFTGEMTDPSRLVYLRARYMSSQMGMFLTKDPFEGVMQRVMSRNGYTYVEGNPVNYTDPRGKFINVLLGATVGFLSGLVTSHLYADFIYREMASGRCDCQLEQLANDIPYWDFVNAYESEGAKWGAALGALASLGPLALIGVSAFGIGTSATTGAEALGNMWADVQARNQLSTCDQANFVLGVVGTALGLHGLRVGTRQLFAPRTTIRGPYSHLEDPPNVGPGREFTDAQRRAIRDANIARNGGVVRSDLSGEILVEPQASRSGVTHAPNEWAIDHIVPRSQGGTNSYSNAQMLSRAENGAKYNHMPPAPPGYSEGWQSVSAGVYGADTAARSDPFDAQSYSCESGTQSTTYSSESSSVAIGSPTTGGDQPYDDGLYC
jgi:RHS repeat-associated protein